MSDRDDAPPAVDDLAALHDALRHYRVNEGRDAIPDAARWRLAAWIVAGLEPTREMVERMRGTTLLSDGSHTHVLRTMLAAAREAGDA